MRFHSRLAATALIVVASGISTLTHAASVSGQGTWETTLQARDLDGNLSTAEAYYDTSLNITWLADASYAVAAMNWSTANAWAANLNPYGSGITGWRLSNINTSSSPCNLSNSGTNCGYSVDTTTSELAHMFHVTLGNTSYVTPSGAYGLAGSGLTNTGNFINLLPYDFWSSTDYAPYGLTPTNAWHFDFNSGQQTAFTKTDELYAWAVHAGDVGVAATVSTIPVPAAAWLFGSGLLGLIGVARRKAA